MPPLRRIACVVALVACPAIIAQKPGEASVRHRFDIPAGSVAQALQVFARQSGRQILFPYDAASTRTTPPIRAERKDRDLLALLARRARLIVVYDDRGIVVLQQAPMRRAGASPPAPRRTGPMVAVTPALNTMRPAKAGSMPVAPSGSDIVVTAGKRSETVLDVPIAITALPGDDLKTLGVQSAADLQNVVPGLSVNTVQHGISLSIRGVTTTDVTSKGEQGIAFTVDGIFPGRPIEQGLAFFDLARVEVLRGPQGTLYGKSSTGGAVNLVTNKPVDRWEGYATLETGNFGTRRGEGAINIPVTDWLAVRAAADANVHAGFLKPSDGSPARSSQDDRTGRFSALAHATPDVTLRVTLTAGHVGGTGAGYAELGNFLAGTSSAARRMVYPNPFPARLDHHFLNVDGEADATLGGVQLTYIGGRLRFDGNEQSSNTNDPNNPNAADYPFDRAVQIHGRYRTRIVTDEHEVRLANPEPGFLDYVVGANYHHEHIDEDDHQYYAPLGDADAARSVNDVDIIGTTNHTSYGLFGQATAHVTTRLGLVGGLRYSRDSVRRRGTSAFGLYDASGAACYGLADCIGNPNPGRQSAAKPTFRVGLNFQPTERHLFYASVATGYKAGGFNDATSTATAPTTYAPEQLTAYEVGYKGRPTDRLRFESSLYFYDYARTQIAGVVGLNGGAVLNTRVVPTILYGWENQATWTIARDTSLTASLAYEHSYYVRFLAGYRQDADWSHLSLDRTPALVAMIAANRSWRLPGDWSLRLRAFTKLSSHYYLSDFTSALRFRQKGYSRSDASLTLAAPGDRWYVQAFVQNIENGLQAVSVPQNYDATFLNGAYLNISDPRLYGVRIGFSFR